MKPLFFAFFLTVLCFIPNIEAENCDKLGVLLYEDLGCTPHYVKSSKCPVSYTCQGIGPWQNRCHYKDKIYNDNEYVEDKLSSPICKQECLCSSSDESSEFLCVSVNCPKLSWRRPFGTCFNKYSLDSCCPVGITCPNKSKTQCSIYGKTYSEGEKVTPREACIQCVCQKGFIGITEDPFCRRLSCGVQLLYSRYIQNVCAPLYSKEFTTYVRCCPDSWICDDGSAIIQGQAESSKICMFGKRTLNVGQFFEKRQVAVYVKKVVRVVCKCEIPPLLTCTEIY